MSQKKIIIQAFFLLPLVIAVFFNFSLTQEAQTPPVIKERYEDEFTRKIRLNTALNELYLHQKGILPLEEEEYNNVIDAVVSRYNKATVALDIHSNDNPHNHEDDVRSLGITVFNINDERISADVPVDRFAELIDSDWVKDVVYISPPILDVINTREITEEFDLIGVGEYNKNGYKGKNIKL